MSFNVGISGDLLTESGVPCFGLDPLKKLEVIKDLDITWMDPNIKYITQDDASKFDAILLNLPKINMNSLTRDDLRLKIVARFGVGYDSVDVNALKMKNIILTNTPNAVRTPVAVATLTMILALSSKIFAKDKLLRLGKWNNRTDYMGIGLSQKTLGVIGCGNIGKEFIKISKHLFKNVISYDPNVAKGTMLELGVKKVDFYQLAKHSDFVTILCDLNESTKGLIDIRFLNHMKKSSILVNLSRGSVINEHDLINCLKNKRIFGAGLDVMEFEPIERNNELMKFENVILTPHSLCWTEECFDAIASEAISSIVNYYKKEPIKNKIY